MTEYKHFNYFHSSAIMGHGGRQQDEIINNHLQKKLKTSSTLLDFQFITRTVQAAAIA